MKNIVKKIYCSQIGSTVIATLIASFVGFVIKCLYSIVKPLYKNFSIESFADFKVFDAAKCIIEVERFQ